MNYFREVERQHPYSEWSRRAILMTALLSFLHILGSVAAWSIASPAHAGIAATAGIALALMLRSRPKPPPAPARGSGGMATVLVAAGGLLTGWWLLAHPGKQPPAGSVKKRQGSAPEGGATTLKELSFAGGKK